MFVASAANIGSDSIYLAQKTFFNIKMFGHSKLQTNLLKWYIQNKNKKIHRKHPFISILSKIVWCILTVMYTVI